MVNARKDRNVLHIPRRHQRNLIDGIDNNVEFLFPEKLFCCGGGAVVEEIAAAFSDNPYTADRFFFLQLRIM